MSAAGSHATRTIFPALAIVTSMLAVAGISLMPTSATAQPAAPGGGMPDLRLISGKPLPDRGMATGTISVRVVRQTMANAVANVEITALLEAPGGEMRKRTAKTDAGGRALFEALTPGHRFRAELVVDGEKLATETFAVPDVGGVRTMLIAALGEAVPGAGNAQPRTGEAAPAAGGADGAADEKKAAQFSLGFVSGTVKRDPTLPLGTIEVLALDESGRPLSGKQIELGHVRTGGKIEVDRQNTDAAGVVRFTGIVAGKPGASPDGTADVGAAVVMQHGSLRLGTDGFGIPDAGGLKVELRVPQRTSDPSVITIGPGGRVILQLRDDAVSFIETLPLVNTSDKLFDPGPGGVEIRLPSEFVNAEGAEGEHKIEIRKGLGVAVHGIIPPRRPQADPNAKSPDEITFGFVLPLTGSSRSFEQKFALGLGEFTFVTDQVPGLTVESAQITGRQDREFAGKKYWLMRGEPIPPGGTLRFTVRGLPAPDNTGRIVAGSLALALVGAALVFGRKGGSTANKGIVGERDKLVQRREKLFADLVAMESRAAPPGVDRSARGELVQKLESIYREIAALDERRAV